MRNSLYEVKYKIGEDRKNRGFQYKGLILKKSLSRYLYTFDGITGFLETLETAVYELYELVKVFKNRSNYIVAKDEYDID